jgi:hypothetical protein
MPKINFPSAAQNPTAAGVLSLAKVYIGTVDTDPRILANRLSVTIIEQDGDEVVIAPAAQPFVLNAGGLFTYGGSVVNLIAPSAYSMAVDTAADVQMYYLPNSSAGEDVSTSVVTMAASGSPPAATLGTGKLFTMTVGGIVEFFYEDSTGQIIQLTENGAIKVTLGDSVVEALRLIAEEEIEGSQFRGAPIELVIDGDGNVDCDLTLGLNYYLYMDENVNTFSFTNAPEIRVPNISVKIENSGAFDITTFEFTAEGGIVQVPDSYTGPLSPTHNATTDYGLALFQNNADAKVMSIYPVLMQVYTP